VHDDLEARALYLANDGVQLCLVVCDLLGMSPGYSFPARRSMASTLGTTLGCVLVSCTHTHSGPSAIAGTDAIGWPNPGGYDEVLREGCAAAARAARDAAAPANLRYVRARLSDGLAFNRRGLPYEEPSFSVLDVRSSDGARLGVVANFSIHPVLLGPGWLEVATDWVGPFRRSLEGRAGGTAIELTGALGDINPTPPDGEPKDSYEPWASAEQTASYGTTLAGLVADALEDARDIDPTLSVVRAETIEAPVGGTPIAALVGEPTMKVDLVEWQIGDVRLVSVPGEAFHLLGREIAAARNDRVLLAGISPAWHGYLPHPWGDGYEEGVSFGEDFVRTVREQLVR
jgi:hypothetical protein